MHLTNYAVNKKSDNFQQAATDDDEGGSKRSLDWFMNFVRDEYGEKKANWLWKRFGKQTGIDKLAYMLVKVGVM